MSNIQNRYFVLGMLLLIALVLTGCTSHPPSAAQFMNVNPKGFSFIVGGAARMGDLYSGRSPIDVDNIDEENSWDVDLSMLYQFEHALVGFSFENDSFRPLAGARWRYIGLQGWAGMGSMQGKDGGISGGLMLIEEYPILDNLKVGISEHISQNAYIVDPNCGGLGIPSTYGYGEFGVGTYLTFAGFSLEFRYGREISEPRNRFYFMMNYAFRTKGESK